MCYTIAIIGILILVVILFFMDFKPKCKEGFFYWFPVPQYITGTFNMKSAVFAAELSNLAYYAGTSQENLIQNFMNKYGLTFNPVDNILTYLNTDTAFIWATDTRNTNLYISFRGTLLNENNIKSDLYQKLTPLSIATSAHAMVSSGFLQAYLGIRQDLWNIIDKIQPNNVIFTGHSLGASLATLAAFDVKFHERQIVRDVIAYTFASPRVGDIAFATQYNKIVPKTYRVQNIYDPIPRFPTQYQGYLHVDDEVLISPDGTCSINGTPPDNLPYNIENHGILKYLQILTQLLKNNAPCVRYERFNIRSYCTGGNTRPAYGHKQCIY